MKIILIVAVLIIAGIVAGAMLKRAHEYNVFKRKIEEAERVGKLYSDYLDSMGASWDDPEH